MQEAVCLFLHRKLTTDGVLHASVQEPELAFFQLMMKPNLSHHFAFPMVLV